jgi:Delta7-sterol 5-desaturase
MSLPIYSPLVTFLILSLIMISRYFICAGLFYFFTTKTLRAPVSQRKKKNFQNISDIKWSLLSSFIFAASGTFLISLYHRGKTVIYFDIADYGIIYFLVSLPLYLFIHDTYFYWTHRWLHHQKIYRFIHCVHHDSIVPTAWTSFSFHPLEALIQAIILPVLLVMLPLHWGLLIVFLSLMTITGILNHLGYELYPSFLEKKMGVISASHHQFHHEEFKKNFGLYFTWWDHWMRTEGARHG